jgi:hypothetical protein
MLIGLLSSEGNCNKGSKQNKSLLGNKPYGATYSSLVTGEKGRRVEGKSFKTPLLNSKP